MNKLSLMLAFYISFPLCFIARYLRKIYLYIEKKEGEQVDR